MPIFGPSESRAKSYGKLPYANFITELALFVIKEIEMLQGCSPDNKVFELDCKALEDIVNAIKTKAQPKSMSEVKHLIETLYYTVDTISFGIVLFSNIHRVIRSQAGFKKNKKRPNVNENPVLQQYVSVSETFSKQVEQIVQIVSSVDFSFLNNMRPAQDCVIRDIANSSAVFTEQVCG